MKTIRKTVIKIILLLSTFIIICGILSYDTDTTQLTPIPIVKIVTTNICEGWGIGSYHYGVGGNDCFKLTCLYTSLDGKSWELERCDEIR